jgi:hypothetical protein
VILGANPNLNTNKAQKLEGFTIKFWDIFAIKGDNYGQAEFATALTLATPIRSVSPLTNSL